MQTYQKSPSSSHLETVIVPAVEVELQRIHAREKLSGRNRSPNFWGNRKARRKFPGSPSGTLGPLETQACQLWQLSRLGYAAGFIDADGCISAVEQTYPNREHPSTRIRIDIVQNHHGVLKHIQDILDCGGHLNRMKRQSSQNRDCYQLTYDGWHAVEVLMKLRDLLERKKAEADACLHLFIDGQLSRGPGRKGLSPQIIAIRQMWVARIKSMK